MDRNIYWTTLCGEEPLWDFNLTWNTTSPKLTNCFQQTVLVWLPSIFLCSFGSIETIMTAKETRKPIPLNKLNLSRSFLITVCIFTFIIEGSLLPSKHMNQPTSSIRAHIIGILMEIFNYGFLMFISSIHRSRGVHTSPVIWIFSFLEVLCSSFVVGQICITEQSERFSFQTHVTLFRVFVKTILLILFSFSDVSSECEKVEKSFDQCSNEKFSPQERKKCPILTASFPNNLTFWWFTPMCITGFRRSLVHADLWELPHKLTSKYLFPQFEKRFNIAIEGINKLRLKHKTYISGSNWPNKENSHDYSQKKFQISVVPILTRINANFFILGGIFKLLQIITMFFSPVLLKYLIQFIEDGPNQPIWHGIFIALAMFFTSMLQCFFFNACLYHMFLSSMRLSGVMTAAIYKKSLRLGNKARQERTSGEIVNLMAVDSKRFNDLIPTIHHVWASPLQVIIAMYFLYQELGYSALFGLGVMICMVPLNAVIAYFSRRMQVKLMKRKDDRIKSLNEILNYMRIIKFYAWEESFSRQISTFREQELKYLRRIQFLSVITSFLWTCAPMIVSVTTFAVFVTLQGGSLTAQNAFVSLSLFNILKFPLYMIPQLISSLIMASVSVKRINSFLSSENLESYIHRDPDTVAISMENGYFKWDSSVAKLDKKKLQRTDKSILNPDDLNYIRNGNSVIENSTLKNVNIQVKKGSFVAIVGSVGSGKSSLLSALLGEMNCVHGKINISGELEIAYVAQQAWIQNTTLKNNILFGLPYNDERYRKVIEACALGPDIEFLPGGDETEIGEKGINLSGGQKQRVSLARACYSDADLFFMDDPLSAVDAHVAKHLFDNVLSSKTGLLKNKTRLLVTNRLDILSDVDNIVVLKNGCPSEIGNYDHLMNCDGDFSKLVNQFTNTQSEQNDVQISVEKKELLTNGIVTEPEKIPDIKQNNNNELIKNERVETGAVKWNVYSQYFAKASTIWSCIIILSFTTGNAFSIGSNVWLSVWSSSGVKNQNSTDTYHYLSIYVLFGGLQGIFVTMGLMLMVSMAFRASVAFHRDLLYRVLHSPMSFFDTTPSGRILNRFSKDLDTLDTLIPTDFRQWLLCFLNVVGTFIIISVQTPMFMLILVPIGCIYMFIQRIYVSTSRQIRRLESITRSPIYSHFSETLSGVDTIRAFNAHDRFMAESGRKVDSNQICFYATLVSNRWLSVRLEFCGHLIVFSAAMFAIFARDTLSGGDVGLSVSYALSITNVLAQMVRTSSLVEANIVAVERILEYCQVPSEADWFQNHIRPEPDWPREGEIVFQNYQARYRSGLDLVLRNINVHIRPREKIGIVGRTGAGKSTITLALFRLIEAANGKILIDKYDISQIPLHPLRSKLAIIPQDPVLFSGTLRFNLDPFDLYSDQQIWESLSHAHLKNFVLQLSGGLQYPIAEEGKNLSLGQRQLICLARALLKKPKILFLDEATAAIDMETDRLIQKAIRDGFRDCTTLTIAHRLNTVMDSDRVMVLDQGRIVEFDSPDNLLKIKDSLFYSLAKEANVIS